MGLIGLITDFGDCDEYAGVMKAVILGLDPRAVIVDVTHAIEPQDIRQAAFVLRSAYRFFPPGSLLVVVVDPGVGTDRAILCVESDGRRFLAPDNGVLSFVIEPSLSPRCRVIDPAAVARGPVSATFHGRDLFAPAAGRLSRGEAPFALGPEIPAQRLRHLEGLQAERTPDGGLLGRIVHVDRFGNLITNIEGDALEGARGGMRIYAGGIRIEGLCRTYADAAPGSLLALVGSRGMLEIAVCGDHAAARTGIGRGETVRVEFLDGK